MATDIDIPPLYDQLTKKSPSMVDVLNDVWMNWFATFYQTLASYLTHNGIFVPRVTIDQINSINIPIVGRPIGNFTNNSGQMVYDTTNSVPKIFVLQVNSAGIVTFSGWKTFTIT